LGYTSNGQIFLARNTNDPRIWRGATSPLPVAYSGMAPGANVELFAAIAGLDGDIIFVEFNYLGNGRAIYRLPGGSTTAVLSAGSVNVVFAARLNRLDRFGRGLLLYGSAFGLNCEFFPTYETATGRTTLTVNAGSSDPLFNIAGVGTHFVGKADQVPGADGQITAYTTASTVLGISTLRDASVFSDPQTRTVVAAWTTTGAPDEQVWFSIDGGIVWNAFDGPASFSPIGLAVVVRQ
jgi:hypothetical protein